MCDHLTQTADFICLGFALAASVAGVVAYIAGP